MSDEVDNNQKSVGIGNIIFDDDNQERSSWIFFGKRIPRSQVLFFVQVLLVTIIITVSIINLTVADTCEETTVWVAILSSSVGYMLPAPKL